MPQTIQKDMARERLRQRVFSEQDAILDAQIGNAKGIHYLVLREKKSGKFLKRITDPDQEMGELDPEREIISVYAKDPSIQAAAYLFDQAMDKAGQPVQDLNVKMPAIEGILARLAEGRKRVAARIKA